jgi:hypothetical protein
MLVLQTTRIKETGTNPTMKGAEEVIRDENVETGGAQKMECNSLVLMHVNCRNILNKSLDFCNLFDTYNPDIIIGMNQCLSEEIRNAEVFRDDFRAFRKDRTTRDNREFFLVKRYIACVELWAEKDLRK